MTIQALLFSEIITRDGALVLFLFIFHVSRHDKPYALMAVFSNIFYRWRLNGHEIITMNDGRLKLLSNY